MQRNLFNPLALVLAGTMAAPAAAQVQFAFKFKAGEPIVYRTTHETKVQVKQGDESTATSSIVRQTKQWDVRKVDSLGVATLELTIAELVLEQTEPSGDVVKFDSNDSAASNPQLAEKLNAIVGKPILQVQVDSTGQIKAHKHLTDREDALRELPFVLTVPKDRALTSDIQWQRDFPIQLDPPLGNHETIRGVQICSIEKAPADRIVVRVENKIIDKIDDPKRRVPLVQFLPKGTVSLDPRTGRMTKAEMIIDQTIADFDGAKGQYKFTSKYTEELQPALQQADRRE